MQLLNLKWKPGLTAPSKNPRALGSMPSALPAPQERDMAWTTAWLFTTRFTDCFKPAYCSANKDSFENITAH